MMLLLVCIHRLYQCPIWLIVQTLCLCIFDYAQMQLTKDVNGQYLRPFRIGDELIQGLKVETSTAIKQGDIRVGDFNYLNIRDVWVLTITLWMGK